MLIGQCYATNAGIRLVDVDGSQLELNASDALDLLFWLKAHREELLEIVRREQTALSQKKQKEEDG